MQPQTTTKSYLSDIHPFIKIYVFLFVILFASLISNYFILFVTTSIVLVIYKMSKINLKPIWNFVRFYLVALIPVVFFLTLLEHPNIQVFLYASITYLRFFNILFIGAIFSLTTRPLDLSLLFLRHKSRFLNWMGFALAAGFSSLTLLQHKVKNTIMLQQLRGKEYSLNPFKIKKTFQSLKLALISNVLQTIELSEDFTIAMVARGFGSKKITLPPYFSLKKTKNLLLLILGTLYLSILIKEMLKL